MPHTSPEQGYHRYPTVHGDTVVFVSDDDLWSVPLAGGTATRLTSGLGSASHAKLSPDGHTIAFSADEEGVREVYTIPTEGGQLTRLTWEGGGALVQGWSRDGREVVYTTNAGQAHLRDNVLRAVPASGGSSRALNLGLAMGVAWGPGTAMVLCRHSEDIARWKRYRGGRIGQLWVDATGEGTFARIPLPVGNVASPLWIGDRIWFVSDHDYDGNLYSCRPDGSELTRHTHHHGHFVRWPDTDGRTIVYARGGDLHTLDLATGLGSPIPVAFHSPRTQTQRRFVPGAPYLQHIALHPDGHSFAAVSRGKLFVLGNWEGPVRQLGQQHGVRYRLPRYLPDGSAVLVVSDEGGEEAFEIRTLADDSVDRLDGLDVGRALSVAVNPTRPLVAITNQRQQLLLLDLVHRTVSVVDHTDGGRISGLDWSACGRWLAYARPEPGARSGARIRIYDTDSGDQTDVTDGRYTDMAPSFDPDGNHLYFLSHREFDPVYDAHYFDLNFPKGVRPYLVTLRRSVADPFQPAPRRLEKSSGTRRISRDPIDIDTDGIADRVLQFPVSESRYTGVVGVPGGRVLLSRQGVAGSLDRKMYDPGPPKADNSLYLWDFTDQELNLVSGRVTSFAVDIARYTLVIRSGFKVRITWAAPDKGQREELRKHASARPGRRSGWVDLARIHPSIRPRDEWRQMLRETWRLMRDQFWTPDMSGHDWEAIWSTYAPLVERISTRGELSDLIWTMQGELGTSHAYEMGGDYRRRPRHALGSLGAELDWQDDPAGYRVSRLIRGEPGDPRRSSPLCRAGVDVREGDLLIAIDGRQLQADHPPGRALAHQTERPVSLTFSRDGRTTEVVVRTLRDAQPLAYRDWVIANRRRVHEATGGRAGYVHIPNMGPTGYAEFHRDYLAECNRVGLVVDVRYNGGGHVSQLLLEKLARRRLGYNVSRYRAPAAYPAHSVLGPMVCLTNEMAGSDGDIFSHSWKLLELGPLIGHRTWGGVIGIWPRHTLVDKAIVTQPEFSYWFNDVAWGVENGGTEPDVPVDIAPHHYRDGVDPQLDTAVETLLEALEAGPQELPPFDARPRLGR